MSDFTGLSPKDMNPEQLRQALREARLDRDGWHTQARLAENHLERIKRSPAWRLSKPLRVLNLIAWKIRPSLYSTETKELMLDESAPIAWDLIKDHLRIESEEADLTNSKIAIVAQWTSTSDFPFGTSELLRQLIDNKYSVILVSANELDEPLQVPADIKRRITIVRKPNVGYDFGSWSTAFHLFPQIFEAQHLLILNDSNAGPFSSIKPVLNKLENSQFDLTGITDSLQIRYHLQSYFLHLNNRTLNNESVKRFWLNVRHHEDKFQVIQSYELGFTSLVQAQNLYAGAIYPWNLVSDYWENPSIHGATRLLELGFPFTKREVLRKIGHRDLDTLTRIVTKNFGVQSEQVLPLLQQRTH